MSLGQTRTASLKWPSDGLQLMESRKTGTETLWNPVTSELKEANVTKGEAEGAQDTSRWKQRCVTLATKRTNISECVGMPHRAARHPSYILDINSSAMCCDTAELDRTCLHMNNYSCYNCRPPRFSEAPRTNHCFPSKHTCSRSSSTLSWSCSHKYTSGHFERPY